MNLDSFTGPGSTPSRRRFWDKVTQAVNASQKVAGRNVSIDEHQGMGTLINVTRERAAAGGCCDTETITITFSGITMCSFLSGDLNGTFVLTESAPGSGLWQGVGNDYFIDPDPTPLASRIEVTCAPDGVPPRFFIDYNPDSPGSFAFFEFQSDDVPPSFVDLANENTIGGCDIDKGSYDGTATITCGS